VKTELSRGRPEAPMTKSHPPESNRRPTDYERTQEVAKRFRRVAVSRKIRELRVMLHHRQAPAGTGMVTGW
jgi:hypothetical protein